MNLAAAGIRLRPQIRHERHLVGRPPCPPGAWQEHFEEWNQLEQIAIAGVPGRRRAAARESAAADALEHHCFEGREHTAQVHRPLLAARIPSTSRSNASSTPTPL